MTDDQTTVRKEPQLRRIAIKGFRSIADQELELHDINVMIGPNGAGKSNFIDLCRMLSFMVSSEHGLATFVGQAGGASKLLHDGPKQTPQMEVHVQIDTDKGSNEYQFRLGHASDDTFIFLEERCRYSARDRPKNRTWIDLGAGHRSPQMLRSNKAVGQRTQSTILHLLRRLAVYQFHDTSSSARVKQSWPVNENRYMRADAANIAAFLLRLKEQMPQYYYRIVETIRLLAPFFDDFVLDPEYESVILRWREIGSDLTFGPSQASDGTLRAICLITLLLQPNDTMPSMLVIDEPELGLHPFAVHIISGLLQSVSTLRQCLIATQSPQLLDEFSADDVMVVERNNRASEFRHLSELELSSWLDQYTLSELWDMNVFGGRPRSRAAQ